MLREALINGSFGAVGFAAISALVFGASLESGLLLRSCVFGLIYGPLMAFVFGQFFGKRKSNE